MARAISKKPARSMQADAKDGEKRQERQPPTQRKRATRAIRYESMLRRSLGTYARGRGRPALDTRAAVAATCVANIPSLAGEAPGLVCFCAAHVTQIAADARAVAHSWAQGPVLAVAVASFSLICAATHPTRVDFLRGIGADTIAANRRAAVGPASAVA